MPVDIRRRLGNSSRDTPLVYLATISKGSPSLVYSDLEIPRRANDDRPWHSINQRFSSPRSLALACCLQSTVCTVDVIRLECTRITLGALEAQRLNTAAAAAAKR